MPQITITIDEKINKKVRLFMAKYNLSSKEKAINEMLRGFKEK